MTWTIVAMGSGCIGPDPSFLGPATGSSSEAAVDPSGPSASETTRSQAASDDARGSETGSDGSERVFDGLVAYYLFVDMGDGIIADRSGVEPPVTLGISDPPRIRWEQPGLTLVESTHVVANGQELRIAQACQASDEFTVEAWVEPEVVDLPYYANVVSFSRSTGIRNFDIGQSEGMFQARINTSETNDNGAPALPIVEARPEHGPVHLVVSMDASDVVRIFADGVLRSQSFRDGDFSKWREASQLGLGNEFRLDPEQDFGWRGTYYLVALYDRALAELEVAQNFEAGIPPG